MRVFFIFWAIVGLAVALMNLAHAIGDRAYVLRNKINAGRQFLLRDEIRRGVLLTASHFACVVLAIGIWNLPPREQAPRTFGEWTFVVAVLSLPVLLASKSIMDMQARKQLQKFYGRHGRRSTDHPTDGLENEDGR